MKKLILILLIFISGCSLHRLNSIGKTIETNINICVIETQKESHSGFLGDGEYFAKIKCPKIGKLSNNWKKLPLSTPLKKVTRMRSCDDTGCESMYKRYSIPNVKNGYYFFLDRHSQSTNKYDDTDLNNRASWNFSLAILDKDTNIIYYYELDT